MSEPFIGEIRLFTYPRGAPSGWQLCDGSLLSIAEYQPLYNLITTTYGGDGSSTFGVPDLRGRVPVHQGTGLGLSTYVMGQTAGDENVTLTQQQLASHFHFEVASVTPGVASSPAGNVPATVADINLYTTVTGGGGGDPYALPSNTIGFTGGATAHDNTAPTLTLNYCIATVGIYPNQG
jgi:microcystin-dependent protein